MIKILIAIILGVLTWFFVATVGNLVLRFSLVGYIDAEKVMHFTMTMMVARLCLSVCASVCTGYAITWVTTRRDAASLASGILLTALFIPVHYMLWDKFPIWYHLLFLCSLIPLTVLGARIQRPGKT
jgi:hypothetical protein